MRILNKNWQAMDEAKVSFDLTTPSGAIKRNACPTNFQREGLYLFTCTFNEIGEWEVTMHADKNGSTGKLSYKVNVIGAKKKEN